MNISPMTKMNTRLGRSVDTNHPGLTFEQETASPNTVQPTNSAKAQ